MPVLPWRHDKSLRPAAAPCLTKHCSAGPSVQDEHPAILESGRIRWVFPGLGQRAAVCSQLVCRFPGSTCGHFANIGASAEGPTWSCHLTAHSTTCSQLTSLTKHTTCPTACRASSTGHRWGSLHQRGGGCSALPRQFEGQAAVRCKRGSAGLQAGSPGALSLTGQTVLQSWWAEGVAVVYNSDRACCIQPAVEGSTGVLPNLCRCLHP